MYDNLYLHGFEDSEAVSIPFFFPLLHQGHHLSAADKVDACFAIAVLMGLDYTGS